MTSNTNQNYIETDFEKYISDLKAPWKTMGCDMNTARLIIDRLAEDEIDLLSISDDAHEVKISFPDWQSEIEQTFINQYGQANGKEIFKKVMMRFFLLSRGQAHQLQ